MPPGNWNDKTAWTKKVLASTATVPTPNAEIIFTKEPFIQYEQPFLDKNFKEYLETIMASKKILRMGAQKASIQKTYEINIGAVSINTDFYVLIDNFTGLNYP